MDDLTFYAAYIPDGDKRRYLGNGEGGLRLLKDRQLLEDYLKASLPADQFAQVVIHPVNGTIAVPESVERTAQLTLPHPSKIISTLAVEAGAPSAVELLAERVGRRRHKAKGTK